MKHIGKQVWQKDEDLKEKEGRNVNWADLKRLIQRQINIITTKNSLITPSSTSTAPVKVAAAAATGNDRSKRQPTNNAMKGQMTGSNCVICAAPHATEKCPVLLRMQPDERVENLKKRGLCFGCLEGRHLLSECPNGRAKCQLCKKGHNTLLHGRTPMNVHAQTFTPGGTNSSLPETASTTSSEALIQPIFPATGSTPQGGNLSTA